MKELTQFRAAYCSGIFVPEREAITALSLLFEKVYLPNNLELVREFSKIFHFKCDSAIFPDFHFDSDDGDDPFIDLPQEQRETAHKYLWMGLAFSQNYAPLFGEVFESEAYPDGGLHIDATELIKQNPEAGNTYRVKVRAATLTFGDSETFPRLLKNGYVPVVGKFHNQRAEVPPKGDQTAKELAALLAMRSVEMVFPRMLPAHPEVILEARDRLSQHLPVFWSAMFKLSGELKKRIEDAKSTKEIQEEAIDLVDTLVRPAVIDLNAKIEKERKDWFYKILSPVQKGIRLIAGNPPLTQQQLITNALVLASDTCMGVAENMRAIESLKAEAGLTYLLDLSQFLEKNSVNNRDNI
ncbi:MAG: hypothetical protein V4554_14755 [Pseudomonadota bacterium]